MSYRLRQDKFTYYNNIYKKNGGKIFPVEEPSVQTGGAPSAVITLIEPTVTTLLPTPLGEQSISIVSTNLLP